MNTTVTFQCPNCSAGLLFDAKKQKFACEFCLSEFLEEELKNTDAAEKAEEASRRAEEFCSHMNEYSCPSCGAEIVSDESTAADFCYYCHNPVVLVGRLSGQMQPNRIIPFKYDKKQAKESFLGVVRKKWFLPKDFFAEEQDGSYSRFCDTVRERAYSRQTLCQLLQKTGWDCLAVYADMTMEEPSPECERLMFVARNNRTVEQAKNGE